MARKTQARKAPAIRSIRFPPEVFERVTRDAKVNYRNFSQQVILLVERGIRELERSGKA